MKRIFAAFALIIVAALTLSACSGGSTQAVPTATATVTVTRTVTAVPTSSQKTAQADTLATSVIRAYDSPKARQHWAKTDPTRAQRNAQMSQDIIKIAHAVESGKFGKAEIRYDNHTGYVREVMINAHNNGDPSIWFNAYCDAADKIDFTRPINMLQLIDVSGVDDYTLTAWHTEGSAVQFDFMRNSKKHSNYYSTYPEDEDAASIAELDKLEREVAGKIHELAATLQ